jgi:hypothetical protein
MDHWHPVKIVLVEKEELNALYYLSSRTVRMVFANSLLATGFMT